jgi:hypothetical protein
MAALAPGAAPVAPPVAPLITPAGFDIIRRILNAIPHHQYIIDGVLIAWLNALFAADTNRVGAIYRSLCALQNYDLTTNAGIIAFKDAVLAILVAANVVNAEYSVAALIVAMIKYRFIHIQDATDMPTTATPRQLRFSFISSLLVYLTTIEGVGALTQQEFNLLCLTLSDRGVLQNIAETKNDDIAAKAANVVTMTNASLSSHGNFANVDPLNVFVIFMAHTISGERQLTEAKATDHATNHGRMAAAMPRVDHVDII